MPLNTAQYQTLEAIVDRVIPADDTPGAVDGGVMDYITGQLQGDLRVKAGMYQAGLDATNAEAIACHGMPFARLTEALQDVLLASLERGTVQMDWAVSPREFFLMIVHHTAEGFYSDPANGGNRDCLSWKMIGF